MGYVMIQYIRVTIQYLRVIVQVGLVGPLVELVLGPVQASLLAHEALPHDEVLDEECLVIVFRFVQTVVEAAELRPEDYFHVVLKHLRIKNYVHCVPHTLMDLPLSILIRWCQLPTGYVQ